jgi:hypothetical protein
VVAADVQVVAAVIEDAEAVADVQVEGAAVADAAVPAVGMAGPDTKLLRHGFTRIYTD